MILKYLGEIMDFTELNDLAAQLSQLRSPNQVEMKNICEQFIIENTYDSNAIDGSTLTLSETALILKEGITFANKSLREHLAAIGHKEACEYVVELACVDEMLSDKVIKELHSIVLMHDRENKGKYRNINVQITGAASEPPQPYLIPVQMEQLIYDYHSELNDYHIVEAIANFHARFGCIHPFIEGNGRTNRLIMNFELIKAGLLPINIRSSERMKYYSCLNNGELDYTTDALINLITDYEIKELKQRISFLQ